LRAIYRLMTAFVALMSSNGKTTADISAVHRRFLHLFAVNDLAGIGACYTEDAQMLVANMDAICGRAAIQAVFKFTAVRGHTLEFQTHELDVAGETAVEVGGYVRRRDDDSLFDRGKYMLIWKRIGGEWKIHRDMFSTSVPKIAAPAPAPFVTTPAGMGPSYG
jgi:ketosteroid isomerase-like protein